MINLSRSNSSNPEPAWSDFVGSHAVGDVVAGRVTSIVSFGAFVELTPGVDGLLHESEWSDRPTLEQRVSVRIAGIDVDRHRVSLTVE